ncbi:hypothetical protein FJZ41_02275 [Candidatus Shapirobacteria bacterium]|nr:hypothetical protein [Candidatus Shapirobacteria bacterium]
MRKKAKEQGTSACCHHQRKPWFKEPLYWVSLTIFLTLIVHWGSIFFIGKSFLQPLFEKFWQYLKLTWWAIGLGFLIGGLINIFVPEELMIKLLGKRKRSILTAVLLGFLASACSHGILAIAVSLFKKGASTAATLAFLLAAPWANLAITILLLAFFGWNALFIIGGALLIAILAGLIFQLLEKKGIIESNKKEFLNPKKVESWHWPGWFNLSKDLLSSSWSLAKMILWWIFLGLFLASILGSYIPEAFFHRFFGPSFWGMLSTLAFASIIEICSEGSAPMAFELWQKTGAFGNVFVFLMAGVATDFTEIGIVFTNIGKKAALALILVTIPLVLLLGFLFNNLL